MVSITLSISEEMKQEMDKFQDINWSAVAREAIKQKLDMLEKFKKFTEYSTFTEKDALSLGAKVSEKVAKKYSKK
ncbi:MAG: hypothetical protein AB7V77_02730 [Candidatus Woesearchaeota archaeon]